MPVEQPCVSGMLAREDFLPRQPLKTPLDKMTVRHAEKG